MSVTISDPKSTWKGKMNGNPSTYGKTKIAAGAGSVTVTCGFLTADSVIKISQNATSASATGELIEAKYDGSGNAQRTFGMNGTFVVSTIDGANATADDNFDWVVIESAAT